MTIKKSEKAITMIEALIILAVVLLIVSGIYQFFFAKTEEVKAVVETTETVETITVKAAK